MDIIKTEQQLTIKNLFAKDEVRNKFQELLGKRSSAFITSVLQIVASNPLLTKADPHSVYHSAAVAATLDLPLNNNLGFAYIVPYNQSYQENGQWKTKQVAQFQMGYKGFIQLAQRSGQFATINATDVREGEIKERDRMTGEIIFEWIKDEQERLKKPIIGYASFFRLLNGFEKLLFMSNAQLNEHGMKYSQTFKKGKGLWKEDPESMATKTVLKLLLSKFAPLSIDMQKAVVADQAVIKDAESLEVEYSDNEPEDVDKEAERIVLMIQEAKTLEDLKAVEPHVQEAQLDLYTVKMDELKATK